MQQSAKDRFLEPECRDGVWVSAELKAAWKCMLDMLEVFMSVCKKYDLEWSMDGGSLLGAIRHKGFIPWDDDLDVAMPRKDYDRLLEVMPHELPSHLLLQSSLTDPEMCSTHLKLRDSRTTAIDPYHARAHVRMNMGIFIDIFPIDVNPCDIRVQEKLLHRCSFLRGIRRNRFDRTMRMTNPLDLLRKSLSYLLYAIYGNRKLFKMRENPFSEMAKNGHDCLYCATLPAQLGYGTRNHREVTWFKKYKEVPFEYLRVKVPEAYDAILCQIYGDDWRTPRRESAYHGKLVLDTKKDYKTILVEQFGYAREEFE